MQLLIGLHTCIVTAVNAAPMSSGCRRCSRLLAG